MASGDTDKHAAMRVMEMDNDWYVGKQRQEGEYLTKKESAGLLQYCLQFGEFPHYAKCPLTRNQRRNTRAKLRKDYGLTMAETDRILQPGIPGKE